jgi:hypothetical protein|tara:strand:- start:24 stop:638 length:615 start_codon:yes stop_codon:yes gene_type:complete
MLKGLPNLMYNFGASAVDPQFLVTKNIWRRAEILREYKSSLAMFDEYVVANGERPEDIALKLYKNPFYNWTLLVINDITNYHDQWPRSTQQLQEYASSKYENPQATKDYITYEVKKGNDIIVPAGKVVPSTFQVTYYDGITTITANPVVSRSYYQYEEQLNTEKERIQLVKPEFIEDFVENYYMRLAYKGKLEVGVTPSEINMA